MNVKMNVKCLMVAAVLFLSAVGEAVKAQSSILKSGTIDGIKAAMAAIQERLSHFNDGSLLQQIEKGESVTIDVPNEIITGSQFVSEMPIEFLPEISEVKAGFVLAAFKDFGNPKRIYVYSLRQTSAPSELTLADVTIYTLNDGPAGQAAIEDATRQRRSPLNAQWRNRARSGKMSLTSLSNVYNLMDGGVLAHPANEPGSVDLLTPMLRSYAKFNEWNALANEQRPPDFHKPLPGETGVFLWGKNDDGQQEARLAPIPPQGYQEERLTYYSSWDQSGVDDLMRALYHYPSAIAQLIKHKKEGKQEKEAQQRAIDGTFQ